MKCTLKDQGLLVLLLLSLMLLSGCSSGGLLKKKDYQESLQSHYRGAPAKALEKLPKGENNTFIKAMEKAYLNLLQGKPAIKELEKYSEILDQRVRYRVSREVKSFFYGELPEGYYASEHEIILLHMLLSWGYSLQGDYAKARVEARKSSHLLEAPWSEEGHFDDAMLRIWLGGLWAMAGSWEEARVDFKAAWHLDQSLKWAKELSELDVQPKQLFIVLGGVGPTPVWDPDDDLNPLRGMRHLGFKYMGRKSKVEAVDHDGKSLNLFLSPDSRYWYQRHLERDNAIHELIEDSRYGQRTVTIVGKESAKVAAAVVWGTTVAVAGIAGGYVIIQSGASNALEGGLVIAAAGVAYGYTTIKLTTDDSVQSAERELNPSDDYRFVRFLPEYVWVGWSNKDLSEPLLLRVKKEGGEHHLEMKSAVTHRNSQVYLTHFSDVDINSVGEEQWLSHEEKWLRWQEGFKRISSAPYRGKTNWDYWLELSKNIGIPPGGDLGGNTNYHIIKISEKSIVITFMKGLFQDDPVLTIDLESQALIADRKAQELLVSSYAPSVILNDVEDVLYSLEDNHKQFIARKICHEQDIFYGEDCIQENYKERPKREVPLNAPS